MRFSNWTTSSPKQTVRQQLQWPTIFYPCQGKKRIPSFSIGSHLHQNPKTNSMSPERIRLIFTNFPLVSVSQHNANSIAISRHNINFYQYNFPAILSNSLRFVDRQSYRAQPISCLDDPIKHTTFILAFYSSDDSWKVLDENVWIFLKSKEMNPILKALLTFVEMLLNGNQP